LKLNSHALSKDDQQKIIITIVVFHVVGLIGLFLPFTHELFLMLVPWHLLFMLAIVCGSHRPTTGSLFAFAGIIYVLAYLVECMGVNTSYLFGNYTYSQVLGVKLNEVPLIIGVNWFLLVYSTGILMKRSRMRSMVTRVILGALLLVLLDAFIEPVAVRYNYWHWDHDIIPFENYASWFLVSAVMLVIFELFKFKKQSMVAPVFLLVQFLFFIILWIL